MVEMIFFVLWSLMFSIFSPLLILRSLPLTGTASKTVISGRQRMLRKSSPLQDNLVDQPGRLASA